jgi:septation ring formation regulator EzrA
MLAALIAIGGLVFWPIREGQGRIDATLGRMNEVMVTRQEMDWRSQRTSEDRARTDTAIADLRTAMLPRNEWQERNLARDHDLDNIRRSMERDAENLQRQLDLQRSDFSSFSSSLGNGRDVIQDLKSEIDRLRNQLTDIRSQQYERTGATAP